MRTKKTVTVEITTDLTNEQVVNSVRTWTAVEVDQVQVMTIQPLQAIINPEGEEKLTKPLEEVLGLDPE